MYCILIIICSDSPGRRPDSYRDSTTLSAASGKEGNEIKNPLSSI
jgi:hypothetical protein